MMSCILNIVSLDLDRPRSYKMWRLDSCHFDSVDRKDVKCSVQHFKNAEIHDYTILGNTLPKEHIYCHR
jgi:hypothetical protein